MQGILPGFVNMRTRGMFSVPKKLGSNFAAAARQGTSKLNEGEPSE